MMPRSTIPQSQPPPPLPPVGSALYHRTTAEKALTDGDLFRCIWCREAFSTMANLSNHIKEAKHGEKDKNLAVTTSVTSTAAHNGENLVKKSGREIFISKRMKVENLVKSLLLLM